MIPNKPFTAFSNKIFSDNRLKAMDRLVYCNLCKWCYGKKVDCSPSQDTIAYECGISRKQVNESLRRLEQFGYISIKRRGNRQSNYYVLNFFDTDAVIKEISIAKAHREAHHTEIKNKKSKIDALPQNLQTTGDVTVSDIKSGIPDVTSSTKCSNETGGSDVTGSDRNKYKEEKQGRNTNLEEFDSSAKNLNSSEVKVSERGKELGVLSTGLPDRVSEEGTKKTFTDEFSPPAKDTAPKKLTTSRTIFEIFSEAYQEYQESAYYASDMAKTLKQCERIFFLLEQFYKRTVKNYYENDAPRSPTEKPSINFLFEIFYLAFDNQNIWAFKQQPTVGLFLKNMDSIINYFLQKLNEQLRNTNKAEIIYQI